jgi:hypothetical protein
MRRTIFSLAVLSLSLCASAQPRSSGNSAKAAIRYVTTVSTSSFDSLLPRISLADFLSYETGSVHGKWATVECETRTAPAADYARQDFPTCVQADYDLKPTKHLDAPVRSLSGGFVTILISVETCKNGQFRGEVILNLAVTDATGTVHQIRNLADLPMELHRPLPRTPKDLPFPVG